MSELQATGLYFYIAQGAVENYSVDYVTGNGLADKISRLDAQWRKKKLSPVERKRQLETAAWLVIRKQWPTVIWQAFTGGTRTVIGPAKERLDALRATPLLSLAALQTCALWGLAVFGAVVSWRNRLLNRGTVVLLVGIVVAVLLPTESPFGYSRYRIPIVPVLCCLAGVGVQKLWPQARPTAE